MRTRAPSTEKPTFGAAGDRLRAWLRSLDRQDPYRELGVSPLDSEATIRERYRELARRYHPDRGGDAEAMRRLNAAYERVLTHREQRQREALEAASGAVAQLS
jgi:DnaJ-domain-containing protein 1